MRKEKHLDAASGGSACCCEEAEQQHRTYKTIEIKNRNEIID